ncbi:MAG: serine/threonine protein kinase, partial [Gammaproteobacteria bacterium]|nr:serine/threonine protein kinase [Gammaproteobacteria bacterium]
MIDEFKVLLQKFVKKECGIDEVTTHLQQLLKKHPQLAEPIQGQIDQLAQAKRIDQSAADTIRKITAAYTDSGGDKTVISSDDDKTEVTDHAPAPAPQSGDITSATALEDNDATLVSNEVPEKTHATMSEEGFGLDIDATGSDPSATGPTIGPDGMPTMAHGDEIIDVGSVLRNRFELVSKLGEGGMGAVFLAIDKIKEEAQDKHPKVAVKVLNETFKQFRESFIALQRESSKQQRLAHPNIATVFDFDRDYTYGTVFMTMEFMEGEPLDKFIRRVPPSGLSYEEAKPMIDGMCNGLAYAHHHDLVHSDFKPANTFLNKDGVVKLLDFGIARAAKPKLDKDGHKETTLFDPGTLGALTPAYASTEMLEGETPEPSDDIYALACVTYQLLGGKHPFNKMPANQARDNKLSPAHIKKLNRRQNKALLKALALSRDKRTQTVEEFLDGITPKKPIMAYAIAATLIMLSIIGVLARGVIEDHFRNERNNEMSAVIIDASANRQASTVAERLNTLLTYDEESQDLIKADPDVQKAIVGYFTRRMDEQIDREKGKYNYPGAATIMSEARTFYPDSGTLDAKQEDIDSRKAEELQNQRDLYTRFLKIGPWLPIDGEANDIPDVITTIKTIDPNNSLLTDPRLLGSYLKEAKVAREEALFDRAENLVTQAGQYTADKTDLTNEADQLSQSRHLSANQELLKNLLNKVTAAGAASSLSKASSVSAELAQIRLLAPENEQLATISTAISSELLKSIKAGKDQQSLSQP